MLSSTSFKYEFTCWDCSAHVEHFAFSGKPRCTACDSPVMRVRYPNMTWGGLVKVLHTEASVLPGLWRYYDFLPLRARSNIVTAGEGNVPVERWKFLEAIASESGVQCQVFAHRHDGHPSTGSFKDLAGSLVASALREHGITDYVVASTGNIGVSFARYLAASGCNLHAFVPASSAAFKRAELACFGQTVFCVDGDYQMAKQLSARFARTHGFPLAGGTFDPFRIEAKKTLAFEWYRRMEEFPDVYIQALSGGTGPLGVYKGAQELKEAKLTNKLPRLLLVQPNECAPMANAWSQAKTQGFPEGWPSAYEPIKNPKTEIPTLATGNPYAYPHVARAVRDTNGEIFSFPEKLAVDVARVAAYEVGVRMGPAAAVGVGGFFSALRQGLIKDGEVVVIAIGEGIRRDPAFMEKLVTPTKLVSRVEDCQVVDRKARQSDLWSNLRAYLGLSNTHG